MDSKLKSGNIPANTECPFVKRCTYHSSGRCHHKGKDHTCEFSCALARLMDQIDRTEVSNQPSDILVIDSYTSTPESKS